MLTIHAADELRYGWDDDTEPVKDGAVAVEGDRAVWSGTLTEVQERFPGARVRRWPGVIGPALLHLGPLPDAPTPRERVHEVLKRGATAVLEEYADTPELQAAAARNDVIVVPRGTPIRRPAAIIGIGRADLAVFDDSGTCIATVCAGRLVHRRH
ncbi:hypothetical protein PV416_44070 [Streptomyces ipomoeae]|uniref:Uncharacterized protein n=3 Tax=Streptomyces ipomoeae TaxID=103232 RepID=L1KIV6_9ACTN|nr:hypothetical protein [Streptomyces ipomoeae]EKX60494.1 hypothetical protein STRIP9103_05882 [Streptomyces ipomoeae 91-03]MDX2698304.1 hypothetical protein [Streptomyces ipomoeae]MDX2827848.1 hypothetical protein [Streptomyces ipomoeae]MDX2844180.1 hypothetical protein [Streptomyces ipomoeae]MDX2880414.1 hypothetical protein [Streptomyces ipomoeae]